MKIRKKENKKNPHQTKHLTQMVLKKPMSYRLTVQKLNGKKYNKRQSIHCSILFGVTINENELLPGVAAYKKG